MERKISEQRLNVEFVKEVEKYPCIYDYRRPDYSRKEVIDKAWNVIGRKINLSGPQCRERWKNLRTVLSRNLRPNDRNGRSKCSKQQRKPYYLFEAMKFAIPFIKSHSAIPTYFLPGDSSNSPSEHDSQLDEQADEEDDNKEHVSHIKVEVSEYIESRTPSPDYSSPPLSPQVNILEAPSHTSPTPQTASKRNVSKRKKSSDTFEADAADEDTTKACKKKKVTNYNKIKPDLTKISKKRFLLSLLSDVYSMDNVQMRSFRIKVLNLINEITATPSSGAVDTLCSECRRPTAMVPSQVPEEPTESQNSSIAHSSDCYQYPIHTEIKIEEESVESPF